MYPHFNPRPPRGGRPELRDRYLSNEAFQSTPPARGATFSPSRWNTGGTISIHAPREGGDAAVLGVCGGVGDFNPRPPRGGRPAATVHVDKGGGISIHAPREGGDRADIDPSLIARNFNPRPPRGGRRNYGVQLAQPGYFNPRPPRGGRPNCFSALQH